MVQFCLVMADAALAGPLAIVKFGCLAAARWPENWSAFLEACSVDALEKNFKNGVRLKLRNKFYFQRRWLTPIPWLSRLTKA